MHAVVHAMCWTLEHCRGSHQDKYGCHAGAFTFLYRAKNSIALLFTLPWQALLKTWFHRGQQHAAQQFLQHLCHRMRANWMLGTWEGRRQDPHLRCTDEGLITRIPIYMPATGSRLQDCILHWHQQASIHAVCQASPVLVIHLQRFCHKDGRCEKDCTDVRFKAGQRLQVPVFEQGISCSMHTYMVISLVFHIGETPQSGHYQACLMPSEGLEGVGVRGTGIWITDDDQRARKITASQQHHLRHDSYLLWLLRCDED